MKYIVLIFIAPAPVRGWGEGVYLIHCVCMSVCNYEKSVLKIFCNNFCARTDFLLTDSVYVYIYTLIPLYTVAYSSCILKIELYNNLHGGRRFVIAWRPPFLFPYTIFSVLYYIQRSQDSAFWCIKENTGLKLIKIWPSNMNNCIICRTLCPVYITYEIIITTKSNLFVLNHWWLNSVVEVICAYFSTNKFYNTVNISVTFCS